VRRPTPVTTKKGELVNAGVLGAGDQIPRPGEIWLVDADEAIVVWVRRVIDGAVEVLAVTLDVNLADEQTVIVPSVKSSLGVELALLTAIRAHVAPGAFLIRVAELPATVTAQVVEVLAAAREGRMAEGAAVGMPVYDSNEKIVEHQQELADLLAGVGPGSVAVKRG